jgi:hypothetical protein
MASSARGSAVQAMRRALADASGTVVETCEYDAWGSPAVCDASGLKFQMDNLKSVAATSGRGGKVAGREWSQTFPPRERTAISPGGAKGVARSRPTKGEWEIDGWNCRMGNNCRAGMVADLPAVRAFLQTCLNRFGMMPEELRRLPKSAPVKMLIASLL